MVSFPSSNKVVYWKGKTRVVDSKVPGTKSKGNPAAVLAKPGKLQPWDSAICAPGVGTATPTITTVKSNSVRTASSGTYQV